MEEFAPKKNATKEQPSQKKQEDVAEVKRLLAVLVAKDPANLQLQGLATQANLVPEQKTKAQSEHKACVAELAVFDQKTKEMDAAARALVKAKETLCKAELRCGECAAAYIVADRNRVAALRKYNESTSTKFPNAEGRTGRRAASTLPNRRSDIRKLGRIRRQRARGDGAIQDTT